MNAYPHIICESLRELSDRDFQISVWPGNRPGVMSAFAGCVEHLFTDSGLDFELSKGTVDNEQLDYLFRKIDTATHLESKPAREAGARERTHIERRP